MIFFDTSYFFAQLVSNLMIREEGRKGRKEGRRKKEKDRRDKWKEGERLRGREREEEERAEGERKVRQPIQNGPRINGLKGVWCQEQIYKLLPSSTVIRNTR